MSKNRAALDIFFKFRVMWSSSIIHWIVIMWPDRKPNWLAFSKLSFSVCFRIVASSTIAIWVRTCCLWWQAHTKLCAVKWFSKLYANVLASSIGQNKGPNGPWTACGGFWATAFPEGFRNKPYILRCDFAVCQLIFPPFVCSSVDHSPNIYLLSSYTLFTKGRVLAAGM
jgi:hypothetical protein